MDEDEVFCRVTDGLGSFRYYHLGTTPLGTWSFRYFWFLIIRVPKTTSHSHRAKEPVTGWPFRFLQKLHPFNRRFQIANQDRNQKMLALILFSLVVWWNHALPLLKVILRGCNLFFSLFLAQFIADGLIYIIQCSMSRT